MHIISENPQTGQWTLFYHATQDDTGQYQSAAPALEYDLTKAIQTMAFWDAQGHIDNVIDEAVKSGRDDLAMLLSSMSQAQLLQNEEKIAALFECEGNDAATPMADIVSDEDFTLFVQITNLQGQPAYVPLHSEITAIRNLLSKREQEATVETVREFFGDIQAAFIRKHWPVHGTALEPPHVTPAPRRWHDKVAQRWGITP